MLVRIRNLDIFERSIPTPVNTAIPVKGNESVEFEYPKAFDSYFMNLKKFNFSVECISQIGDVTPFNPNFDYRELVELIKEAYDLIVDTPVCDDGGIHIPPDELWVTEFDHQALLTTYEYAISVNQESDSQDEIDSVVEKLRTAINDFKSARQYGIGVNESLPKITQYGFCDDGIVLDSLLGMSGLKDNSFFFKLDKPLDDDTSFIVTSTIDEHKFEEEISVSSHPELATRSLSNSEETVVWSLGTSNADTDIDKVDGQSSATYEGEWPALPNEALLTISTPEGEIVRGVDERQFVDRPVSMNEGSTDNHVVMSLNFKYLDEAITKATHDKEGISTSELDGDDIDPNLQWVTSEQLSTFLSALSKAEGIKGTVENQLAINDALSALETATAVFNSQKKYGRKGPFITSVSLLTDSDAADEEGVPYYRSGFFVEQKEQTIVARGSLNFVEDMAGNAHHGLPLQFTAYDGRVVIITTDGDPSEELVNATVTDGYVNVVVPVSDDHREITFKVYRNEDAVSAENEAWVQEYTINCSLVTLEPEQPYISGFSVPSSGSFVDKDYSELFTGSVNYNANSHKVTATGTSTFIEKWESAYGEEDVHWFVPVVLDDIKDGCVVKCFKRENPEEELKHFEIVPDDDHVLVTAISPSDRTRRIVVYRNEENYENDERGQEYVLDFSLVELSADPDPLKSITLLTQGGWKNKQYADLVAPDAEFVISNENHVIKCTGELVWTDWPELVGAASGTHHFIPVKTDIHEGMILSWYVTDSSPSETNHYVINDNTRDVVIQITPGAPKKKFVIYTSMTDHDAQKNGVEYIFDCSEVVFDPKPFVILPAEDEDTLKEALEAEPDYDGNVHINLTQSVELSEELVIEHPAIITGEEGTTLTAPEGLNVLTDLEVDDITIESSEVVVGDGTHTPTVVMNNVIMNVTPTEAGSNGKAHGLTVNTAAYSNPEVTLTGSDITVTPLKGTPTRAIEMVSSSDSNGGGTLTLDGTNVTISGTSNTAVALATPDAVVNISNGSKIENNDYDGILVGYNGQVTIDNSEIIATEPILVDDINGQSAQDAVVEITNGTVVSATNNWIASGSNNTAAIILEDSDNCVVHLDESSSINCVGGGTQNNNEYVGAFYDGDNNSIVLDGTVTVSNNANDFWFIHSLSDGDGLYFDSTNKGDNIVVSDKTAENAYVIDKDTMIRMMSMVPKSDTVNVTNTLETAVKVAQAAQQGDPSKKFVIRMGDDAENSSDTVLPEGITLIGYSEYFTISPLTGTSVLGKLPSTFQNNVKVQEYGFTAQLTGTLLDTDWSEFSSVTDLQEGYYLALQLTKKPGVTGLSISNEFTGTVDKPIDDEDIILLFMGNDKNKKVTVKATTEDDVVEVTLDHSKLVLSDGSGTEATDFFTVEAATGTVLDKDMKDIQKNVAATVNGTTVDLTGNLFYLDSWTQFSKSDKGNFVALKFSPTKNVTKLVMKNKAGKEVTLDSDNLLVVNIVNDNPFEIVATDANGEHTITFTVTGLVCDPEVKKLFEVSIPDSSESLGNKKFSDLQDITINADKSVTGTVHYVQDLKIKDDSTGLNGNYYAIRVTDNGTNLDQVTVQVRNNLMLLATIDTDSDINLIPKLNNMTGVRMIVKQKRTTSGKVDFEETYDLSKLTFDPSPNKAKLTAASVADRSHAWKSVTYSEVMADDVQASLEGNEITVTGTLLQKDGWSAYEKDNQNKWYPVLNLAVENDKQAIAFFKDGEKTSVHHFESGKPNDDIIFVIDNDTKNNPKVIKVYQTEEDANSDVNGTEYTIDFSGCTLLSNEPATLEFEIADQSHSWKGVTYSDIQSSDASLTVEKDTLKITGTFYKVNGWSAFGKKNQDKWYIATKVTRPSNAVVEGSDGRSFLAGKLSDDIVYAFDSTSSKPSFKVYPTAKHKELDFAGRTYTMDLTQVTLVDPYVKLSINTEKTYDIDDPTKLGTFEVSNGEITGTAKKYFGQIASRETEPDQQTGYYISVVADPWEGVSASKNGNDYVPMSDNGKVLVFLGQTENDVEKLYFKNTKANDHIDEFNLNITCTPDNSIPSVDKIGYFATKKELNTYLTDELHLGEDSMNVDDQIFYIHYNAPLDDKTDYVTFVEVKDHTYGVAHTHVDAEETITYFSMRNGFQVDYVDDAVKTDDNSKCDLTDYHGSAKVSLYRVDGEVDPSTYPEKMDKMVEYTVTIP